MTLTDTQIEEQFGPIAYREFQGATDTAKPRLRDWLGNLHTLTDDELLGEAAGAILGSAIVQRFRGNFEADHCMATACYREAKRRHEAAGHAGDCRGTTIYGRAHANVMRSQGHTPSDPTPCSCGKGDS